MPKGVVNLRLVQADVRQLRAGLAVLGHRNPLRNWLESNDCDFRTADLTRGRATASWCSPGEPWAHAITIKPRIGRGSRTRMSDDLSDVLAWALRRWPVTDVVMTPMSWREPELVSFNMLLALWLLSYNPEHTVGRPEVGATFTIASIDSLEPFHHWLHDDCRELKAAIAKLLDPYRNMVFFGCGLSKFERIRFTVVAEAK
jgi:hypothetical protein